MSDYEEWWELLDWSTMQNTFEKLSSRQKAKVMKGGYWSKGKGNFITENNEKKNDV